LSNAKTKEKLETMSNDIIETRTTNFILTINLCSRILANTRLSIYLHVLSLTQILKWDMLLVYMIDI